jgi:hypothetical protein
LKKLISKLKKIKDNAGSGLILVIVALGFIGILTGALLTAVGYVYRLKLYDYNSRDNFYYVEQAMNEIYAGIGNKTGGCMQAAYNYTVENMTYYDINAGSNGAYVTKSNEEANKDFKKKFMQEVYSVFSSAGGSNDFVSSIAACITNDTVHLDDYEEVLVAGSTNHYALKKKDGRAGITVLMYDKDGNVLTGATDDQLKVDKIVVKNIVVSRTANYNRSPANGEFTQTLSADIVIAKPDFEVNFNSINADFNTLLDYTIIADMGIDINQYSKLNIQGNIYAGADYYNKWYNYYQTDYNPMNSNDTTYFAYAYTKDPSGNDIITADGIISSTADDRNSGTLTIPAELVNGTDINNKFTWKAVERLKRVKVDGSGNPVLDESSNPVLEDSDTYVARYFMLPVSNKVLFLDNSNKQAQEYDRTKVESATGYTYYNSYLHDKGTPIIDAKYDGVNEHSKYSGLYINGTEVDLVANMVIVPGSIAVMNSGSLSMYGIESNKITNSQVWADNVVLGGYSLVNPADPTKVIGSSALFNADLYVRDDLQLDADNSSFTLNGSYFGYGDSTKRDNRNFIPIVDPEMYSRATYKKDADGNYYNRDKDGTRVYEYSGDDEYQYTEGTGENARTITVKKGDFVYITDPSQVDKGKTAYHGLKCEHVFRDLIDEGYVDVYDGSEFLRRDYKVWSDTRGHYNSSAIVINGENSSLDLSRADTIFIAGRAYVELSKYTDLSSTNVTRYTDATKSTGINYNTTVKSYRYDAAVDDFRTGDSISVKPSQQAYMPPAFVGTPEPTEYRITDTNGNTSRHDYYKTELAYAITFDDCIFADYFGYDPTDKIYAPCQKYETFGKTYYYYDFDVAYDLIKNDINGIVVKNNSDTDPTNNINDADDMAKQFIVDYQWACKNDARLIPHLSKIDDQSDSTTFEVGNINIASNATGNHIYSSGAISAKNDVTFNVYTAEYANANELNELLDKPDGTNTIISTKADALNLADDLLKKSQYVKFALKNISNTSAKAQLVDRVLGYHDIRNANEQMYGVNGQDIDAAAPYATGSGIRGEGALTPINGYLNFFRIDNNKIIVPKGLGHKYAGLAEGVDFDNETSTTVKEMDLGSGNDIYVTSQDITIFPKDASGKVKGIILAKGDVKFDKTVTSFEGLIVSGGKVFVTDENSITTIKSNPEAVKAILNELQLVEAQGNRDEAVLNPDGTVQYQTNPDGSFKLDDDGQKIPVTHSVTVGDATTKALADEILSLFKAYENTSTKSSAADDHSVEVYDLDYTTVMKYDNWVKNVE